ncbi:MAG: DUF2791 family P-loop domain-containing protein [Betaproteobacteria bacterium]|nr:DUF2791 family P-loop domain-containing protein [Betaproteobacteria bacterium]
MSQGVRYIHVGHAHWIKAQIELLDEIAEDGESDTKFVRGAYGAGKSHFLSLVQDRARERRMDDFAYRMQGRPGPDRPIRNPLS